MTESPLPPFRLCYIQTTSIILYSALYGTHRIDVSTGKQRIIMGDLLNTLSCVIKKEYPAILCGVDRNDTRIICLRKRKDCTTPHRLLLGILEAIEVHPKFYEVPHYWRSSILKVSHPKTDLSKTSIASR